MQEVEEGPTQKLNKVILKEFKETNYQSFSEGQITIAFPYEHDLRKVHVLLAPTEGPYAGGRVLFEIMLSFDYPHARPTVKCITNVLHPNIDPYSGKVCFNILSDEWDSCLRLADYAHALLWLLYHPNLESRLNSNCPARWDQFEKEVKKSISRMNAEALRRWTPPLVTPIQYRSVRELATHFSSLATSTDDGNSEVQGIDRSSIRPVRFIGGSRIYS